MKTISAAEAESRFAQLLEEVAQGEEYTITRQGVPVAVVKSAMEEITELAREQAIEGLLQFRQEHSLRGLSIKGLIEEGRRY